MARDEDRRRVAAAGAEVLVVPAPAAEDVDVAAVLELLAGRGVRRVLAGLLGGATADLSVMSEFQCRDPDLREWYLRFAVR